MAPCEFNSLLARYHDGELAADSRVQFEQHLTDCASCSAELEQMRAISQTLRAIVLPAASAEFFDRLQSLESEVQDISVIRFARRLTAAAAAILVGATLFWAVHKEQPAAVVTASASQVSYPTADERLVIDPDSAAAAVSSVPTPAAVEPQLEQIALDLSGGHP